jgi:hypothetical protein
MKSEHLEQAEFVSWFRQTYQGVRIFAIPNGGARGIATAGRLKVEGVTSGVPDLFIPAWRVWIEMKREKGGVLSPAQKDWISYLESVGYVCLVARGAADAKAKVEALDVAHLVRYI